MAIPLLARAELRWDKKEVERHPTGNGTTSHPVPGLSLTVEQGGGCQCVRMVFRKYTHQGIYGESRRGGPNAPWEFLCIDTESPYEDERPLLVPGQPEVREYRVRYWDKGTPNGDWTDVVKVTVSP